jgi:hypothetical protein
MNKHLAMAVLLLFLSLLAGCNRSASRASPAAAAVAPTTAAAPAGAPSHGRSLVVKAELALRVDDVDAAVTELRALAERSGGYLANASASGSADDRTALLELRVPTGRVEPIRAALSSLGELTTDTQTSEDVTEQQADLGARVASGRIEEQRILAIMEQRAGSVADVLGAEKELARVRESIERLEAEQRTLEHRIDLASVRVTLAKRAIPWSETPGESIASAARAGLQVARTFYTGAAMAVAAVAPTALPFVALVAGIVALARRRRRALAASIR